MEALYFGGTARELFGVRFEPRGAPRRTGVLICPSWGMEYMRSYRGLSLLGRALAERGFETLRFDYACTGDSAGDAADASVERWIGDIGTAARELIDLSGCERVCVLGLRLGALLALNAVNRGLRCDALALWDTPSSGRDWLEEARQIESRYYASKNRYRARDNQLDQADDELIGMPLPEAQTDALRCLTLNYPESLSLRELLSADQRSPAPAGTPRINLPDAGAWQDHLWLTTPWTPSVSMRAVVEELAAWLP